MEFCYMIWWYIGDGDEYLWMMRLSLLFYHVVSFCDWSVVFVALLVLLLFLLSWIVFGLELCYLVLILISLVILDLLWYLIFLSGLGCHIWLSGFLVWIIGNTILLWYCWFPLGWWPLTFWMDLLFGLVSILDLALLIWNYSAGLLLFYYGMSMDIGFMALYMNYLEWLCMRFGVAWHHYCVIGWWLYGWRLAYIIGVYWFFARPGVIIDYWDWLLWSVFYAFGWCLVWLDNSWIYGLSDIGIWIYIL